jgi:transposase
VSQHARSTYVVTDPSEIVHALVGLKDVVVLHLERRGPDVELAIEQVVRQVSCPTCGGPARVKDRPVVRYIDLPVYGSPMRLCWKKHRMRCANAACPKASWVLSDHRIAAKNCLLTTRAAKWATRQIGDGRTIKEVAAELACDWHTVNDAVSTYGDALLAADRKRLNKTAAIGLDETSFVHLSGRRTDYATTVADVEHHSIIDILPSRNYVDVAAWLDKQPRSWKENITFGALDMSATYAAVYNVVLPKAAQVVDPFHVISLANRALDAIRRRVKSNNSATADGATTRSIGPGVCCSWVRRSSARRRRSAWPRCFHSAIPELRWPSPIGSKNACATSIAAAILATPKPCFSSCAITAPRRRCLPRSAGWDAPFETGSTRSSTSTSPG